MTYTVPPVARQAVAEAFALLPAAMASPEAMAMLYAIGLQESRFEYRRQMGNGPARGFWQFEMGGGAYGICQHAASRYWVAGLCKARGVEFGARPLYLALETDDVLAAGAARLLLFTDPSRLPILGDSAAAWALYKRVWRPGKPHPETWAECYVAALDAVAKG